MKPDEAVSSGPARLRAAPRAGLLAVVAALGPGLLVMLADTDAGNIITAAQAGTRWGYRLMPLPVLLMPMLFMVQELAARLGLHTGRGFGELVRRHFGHAWAWTAAAGLAVATIASLITEFDGIAGIGELYGVPRWLVLPLLAVGLVGIVLSGEYRRVERIAIAIGGFELVFFIVAKVAHPHAADMLRDIVRQPVGDSEYRYIAAALVGATFNPWMIFYQCSAVVEKGLGPADHTTARWDTALGAMVTQLVTASVLVATSATLGRSGSGAGLDSVGAISRALTPFLGGITGRLVFSLGVAGASVVAAIVCSLAFAWGIGEVAGKRHALERQPRDSLWFCLLYAGCVLGSAAVVQLAPDLVSLSVAAQAVNALLMPVLVALLIALAATVLPAAVRLRGWYLAVVGAVCTLVSGAGLVGAFAGLL
jgi:Mn2+/Fe2+ NRAMP family transporter